MSDASELRKEIEAQQQRAARAEARARAAEDKIRAIERIHCWTNEDGKRFMFVHDVQVALGLATAPDVSKIQPPPHQHCACFTHNDLPCCNEGHE